MPEDIVYSSSDNEIRPVGHKNYDHLAKYISTKRCSSQVLLLLQNTNGLSRILRYINTNPCEQMQEILTDISSSPYGPILIQFLPILTQIYRFGGTCDFRWMEDYDHISDGSTSRKVTSVQLLALSHIKRIIVGKIVHSKRLSPTPSDFVEEYLTSHLYELSDHQKICVFLILILLYKRITYIAKLIEQYEDNPLRFFQTCVKDFDFVENRPIRTVEQSGPFLEFSVTRSAMNALKSDTTEGLYCQTIRDRTLGKAIINLHGGEDSTRKHEQLHHSAIWQYIEKITCINDDFYFNTKDEILAFLEGKNRSLYLIFLTLFLRPSYDPYKSIKEDVDSYKYWREYYRKRVLSSVVIAGLLAEQHGRHTAVDILSFIHFRLWQTQCKKLFGIEIPSVIREKIRKPGNEKAVFEN